MTAVPAFPLEPVVDGYSFGASSRQSIIHDVAGGAPRIRADQLVPAKRIRVTWRLNKAEYDQWWDFYRQDLYSGAAPFTVNLVLDGATASSQFCYFIPDTLNSAGYEGSRHIITAEIETTTLDPADVYLPCDCPPDPPESEDGSGIPPILPDDFSTSSVQGFQNNGQGLSIASAFFRVTPQDSWTVFGWFQRDGTDANDILILNGAPTASPGNGGFRIVIRSNGALMYNYWDSNFASGQANPALHTVRLESTDLVPSTGWHSFAVASSGGSFSADGVRLFLDGQELARTTVYDGATTTPNFGGSFQIGSGTTPGNNFTFSGELDDFFFLRRRATDAEILQCHNEGCPTDVRLIFGDDENFHGYFLMGDDPRDGTSGSNWVYDITDQAGFTFTNNSGALTFSTDVPCP